MPFPSFFRTFRTAFFTAFTFAALTGEAQAQLAWTTLTLSTNTNQNAAVWSPERAEHLMVGASGTMFASMDALTWVARASGVSTTLNGVAWGSGQYVVVGASGVIRTSPDGVTWTSRTSGVTTELLAVIWASASTTGTGQWMAVGASGTLLTSPTGVTWTKRTTGLESTSNALRALVWTSLNGGTVIAVGDAGSILTSTDGITWASRTSGTTSALNGVTWSGTTAMAAGSNSTVLTSTNATSWTSRTISGGGGGNIALNTVTWGSDTTTGRFITGGSAANSVTASTDGGVNWRNQNINSNIKYAAYDGTRYILLGPTGRAFVSHNGVFPASTVALAPLDSATGVSLTPSFTWRTVAGIRTYQLQLATTSAFSAVAFNDSSVTDTTRILPSGNLSENTDYFWRVRARNVAGAGTWSAVRKFRTLLSPPAAPALSSPANKAAGVDLNPSLQWTSSATATGYAVQLATDSNFVTTVVNDSSLSAVSLSVGPLTFGTTYYWRVKARNAGGFGAWASFRSFATEAAPTGVPAAPTLSTPAIFATGVARIPTFSWNRPTGALAYQIQVSTAANFATTVADDSTLTATSTSAITLAGSTNYYWRVRAKNTFGFGPWAETSTFTTVTVTPEIPVQNLPAAFATNVANPASLTWNAVTGAATYHLQVSLAADFTTLLLNDSTLTGISKTTGILTSGSFHYWRVRAKNSVGTSDWSGTRRFTPTTATPISVGTETFASDRLWIAGEKLGFQLNGPDHVSIRLTDLQGKILLEIASAPFGEGRHEIDLPAARDGMVRLLLFRSDSYHKTIPLLP
jgi:hypothetical protein